MLHPSYTELMDYVNENAAPQENGEPLVQSRYTLVMAAAKRARQIVDARSKVQTSFTAADKPLSVAVKELYDGEVRILGENEEPDPVLPEGAAQETAGEEGADVTDEGVPQTSSGEAVYADGTVAEEDMPEGSTAEELIGAADSENLGSAMEENAGDEIVDPEEIDGYAEQADTDEDAESMKTDVPVEPADVTAEPTDFDDAAENDEDEDA